MWGCAQARLRVAVWASANARCAHASGRASLRSVDDRKPPSIFSFFFFFFDENDEPNQDPFFVVFSSVVSFFFSSSESPFFGGFGSGGGFGTTWASTRTTSSPDFSGSSAISATTVSSSSSSASASSSSSWGCQVSASVASFLASARRPAVFRRVAWTSTAFEAFSVSRATLLSKFCDAASKTLASSRLTSLMRQSRPLTSSKSRHTKDVARRNDPLLEAPSGGDENPRRRAAYSRTRSSMSSVVTVVRSRSSAHNTIRLALVNAAKSSRTSSCLPSLINGISSCAKSISGVAFNGASTGRNIGAITGRR
mmetsp:Transcript_19316/g.62104  ORF Transcript_19316/g.62104 Transcript_19316/m.62104 type:complete len:310 (-) Transcript_19316:158-1087(-)